MPTILRPREALFVGNGTYYTGTDIPRHKALFWHRELRCRGSGGVTLATGFAEALVDLRIAYDRPMVVTSCCRSAAYNRQIGGHPHSLHVYDAPFHALDGAAAIDIAVGPGQDRHDLARIAMQQGWSVGHASDFLHLDRRDFIGLPLCSFHYPR